MEQSLRLAGENRGELEKVLDHYKDDPEKLQAARFLIENMDVHYTLDGEAAGTYRKGIDGLYAAKGKDNGFYRRRQDSIMDSYWKAPDEAVIRRDNEHLKSDYLIAHIDNAFKIWKEDPWVEEYTLQHFCNYVLPYRIGNEPVSLWHERFRKISLQDIGRYSNIQQNRMHKFGIYRKVTGDLKVSVIFPKGDTPDLMLTSVPDVRVGSCETFTAYHVALLRSFGLPAAVDFTPQWGNRSMGHSWAVYLPAEGDHMALAPDEPLGHHFFRRQTEYMPKVFRRTFARQREMERLHRICGGRMPALFASPCLTDVTDEYIATSDIDVALFPGVRDRVVYLAVFDNREWRIVHYGFRKGEQAHFDKMGRNIVYLPLTYSGQEGAEPAGHPFILHPDGRIQALAADTVNTGEVTLLRKYKPSNDLDTWAGRLNKAEFVAAAKEDFSDAVGIAGTGTGMASRFNDIATDYEGTFRYLRLASSQSWAEVAEMELYGDSGKVLKPRILDGENAKDVARCFDGDPLSFNGNKWAGKSRIELDFGTSVHIDSIRILPRNDDNFIREGEQYRLYYWDGTGWCLIKAMTGNRKGAFLVDGIPGNALLLLRNVTKGREERIFTCENGKQVWW